MMDTTNTFTFPKNSLKIKNEPCNGCNQCALYELDVEDEHILSNKMFCASCNMCTECDEQKSTPENFCSECYCPKCGNDYSSLIQHFDMMDYIMQNEYRKQHVIDCKGREMPVHDLSMAMDYVTMETY